MKSGKFARGAGVGLTMILFSCGGSEDGASGGGEIALDALPGEFASVYCSILQQCFGTYLALAPVPDCQGRFTKQFENDAFPAIRAALAAGKVRYDAGLARACIDAMRGQGCDLFVDRNPAPCDDALAGNVPLGSPCSINGECAGDAYCDVRAGMCPGVCATRRPAGGDCVESEACADGFTCQGGKCVAPAAAGDACGGGGGPECRLGLVCRGQSATVSGTCADTSTITSGKLGDDCDPATLTLCDPSLSCVIDTPVAAPLTYTCKAKSAAGAACARGYPEPCPSGQFCDVPAGAVEGGTCTPLPKAGEACLTDSGRPAPCEGELVCAGGTCRERNVNGAACSAAVECYSEHCEAGTCVGDEFCTP